MEMRTLSLTEATEALSFRSEFLRGEFRSSHLRRRSGVDGLRSFTISSPLVGGDGGEGESRCGGMEGERRISEEARHVS
jgi:hypothetical protein